MAAKAVCVMSLRDSYEGRISTIKVRRMDAFVHGGRLDSLLFLSCFLSLNMRILGDLDREQDGAALRPY